LIIDSCISKATLLAVLVVSTACKDLSEDSTDLQNDNVVTNDDASQEEPVQNGNGSDDEASQLGLTINTLPIEIEDHWTPDISRDKQIRLYESRSSFESELSSSGAILASDVSLPEEHLFLSATTGFLPQVGDYIKLADANILGNIASVKFESTIGCGEDDSPSNWSIFEAVPQEKIDFVSVKESAVLCDTLSDEMTIPEDTKNVEVAKLLSGTATLQSPNNKLLKVMTPISEADVSAELVGLFTQFNIAIENQLNIDQKNELVLAVVIGQQQLNIDSIEISSVRRIGSSHFDFVDLYGFGYLEVNIDILEACDNTKTANTHYLVASAPKTEWSPLTLFNERVVRCNP